MGKVAPLLKSSAEAAIAKYEKRNTSTFMPNSLCAEAPACSRNQERFSAKYALTSCVSALLQSAADSANATDIERHTHDKTGISKHA